MSLFGFLRNLFTDESKRPLGNVTYEKAEYYVDRFAELLQRDGGGFNSKESTLPTSYERMKEAFKVECLRLCNHGARFDEVAERIRQGYYRLANFLPDELAEKASLDRRIELREKAETFRSRNDSEAYRAAEHVHQAACRAGQAASEVMIWKLDELNIEWNEFENKYRDRYVQLEKEVDEQIGRMESAE